MNLRLSNSPRGIPIVLSAPSGGGKTTVAEHVIAALPGLVRSVSATTRPPRAGEKDGEDYFFLTEAEFTRRRASGDFLEWAMVHGALYGTPKSAFAAQLARPVDVILTIDPQGAVSIRQAFPDGVFIFLVPPTWRVLEERLCGRGNNTPEDTRIRLHNTRAELTYLLHYDFLVVNDRLDDAVADVAGMIRAERGRLLRGAADAVPFLKDARRP